MCPLGAQSATALLLDQIGGTVFTTGDNVYNGPTACEVHRVLRRRHGAGTSAARDRLPATTTTIRPGPAAYFTYLGAAAGQAGLGLYSYDIATWHVISLNSHMPMSSGFEPVSPGSSRTSRADPVCAAPLRTSTTRSSRRPRTARPLPCVRLWVTARTHNGVDVVLNGHDHAYERFAPQDPRWPGLTRRAASAQFTVGHRRRGRSTRFGTPVAEQRGPGAASMAC